MVQFSQKYSRRVAASVVRKPHELALGRALRPHSITCRPSSARLRLGRSRSCVWFRRKSWSSTPSKYSTSRNTRDLSYVHLWRSLKAALGWRWFQESIARISCFIKEKTFLRNRVHQPSVVFPKKTQTFFHIHLVECCGNNTLKSAVSAKRTRTTASFLLPFLSSFPHHQPAYLTDLLYVSVLLFHLALSFEIW